MDIDFTNFEQVMALLTGPAGVMLWAVMVSDYFRNFGEREPGWRRLSPALRQTIVYAAYIAPPVGFYALAQMPAVAEAVAPHYPFAAALFIGGLALKGYYELKRAASQPGTVG